MLNKRIKFILTSLILGLGFFLLNFIETQNKVMVIGLMLVLTLLLFYLSLKEGLGLNATLLTLILPVFFTGGVGLFWFLLPTNYVTRLPVVLIYAISIYALCLTANIYTVSTIRTIALLRAARGVGFVLTLLTTFLIYDVVLSLRLNMFSASTIISLFSFPLLVQGLWTTELKKKIRKRPLLMSLVFSMVIGQIAIIIHFWPSSVVVNSLLLTVAVYMLLGLGQMKLEGRLFDRTIKEYLSVGAIVFLGMLIATSWR